MQSGDACYGSAKESFYVVQTQGHLSVGVGSDASQSSDEWHWFLAAEMVWGGIHFRDKSAGDTAAGDGGDFDFDVWTCVVLLIMSLHMPAMDRRDGDESRWRGMTPVLDCMRLVDPWLGNTEPNYALAQVVLCFFIEYIDCCIMHDASRKYYLGIFSRLGRIWRSRGSCPYVHCKSGRGSSAAMMYV